MPVTPRLRAAVTGPMAASAAGAACSTKHRPSEAAGDVGEFTWKEKLTFSAPAQKAAPRYQAAVRCAPDTLFVSVSALPVAAAAPELPGAMLHDAAVSGMGTLSIQTCAQACRSSTRSHSCAPRSVPMPAPTTWAGEVGAARSRVGCTDTQLQRAQNAEIKPQWAAAGKVGAAKSRVCTEQLREERRR